MSLLVYDGILEAIEVGSIVINPFVSGNLGPNSYDLTLSKHMAYYRRHILDPDEVNETCEFTLHDNGTKINPGTLYLACTNEFTSCIDFIPDVSGKSTLGRLGLCVHQTAGWGDNGFKGDWTLEITCVQPIILRPGMKIAQIRWNTISSYTSAPYDGKYCNYSNKPMPAKVNG